MVVVSRHVELAAAQAAPGFGVVLRGYPDAGMDRHLHRRARLARPALGSARRRCRPRPHQSIPAQHPPLLRLLRLRHAAPYPHPKTERKKEEKESVSRSVEKSNGRAALVPLLTELDEAHGEEEREGSCGGGHPAATTAHSGHRERDRERLRGICAMD